MTKVIAQKKYYTGMNDLVFKNAAGMEKDRDILNILNNEKPTSSYNKKRRTLDVLATTKDEVFNIELNSSNYYAKRWLFNQVRTFVSII